MNKVIVTGANGFVGSNVCKQLSENGVKIYAIIKDENENIENIKNLENLEIVYCELSEIETLCDKIADRDIDVFYHYYDSLLLGQTPRETYKQRGCTLLFLFRICCRSPQLSDQKLQAKGFLRCIPDTHTLSLSFCSPF